jgi:hypothetical protein
MRRENVSGDKVVRHSDGSIDYDFYRARAHHPYMVERAVFLKSLIELLQRKAACAHRQLRSRRARSNMRMDLSQIGRGEPAIILSALAREVRSTTHAHDEHRLESGKNRQPHQRMGAQSVPGFRRSLSHR